ncbi:MAG: type III pantothenate kinase [Candidatus Krumholzibacteria bacterium]|nr:type III pantothenate kinase [Candidatus Krumholzibacteria bacterium]
MSHDLPLSALIVDAGNSKVRLCGWRGGAEDLRHSGLTGEGGLLPASPLVELVVLETPTATGAESFLNSLQEVHASAATLPVVLSSVVPHVEASLRQLWPQLKKIDHTCDLPFRVASPHPENIGPDRLCNVAAAAACGCRRALVIDAGTATTFDLLLEGEFVGGLIAPGMALAAACLGEAAARLGPVPFEDCSLEPGLDTAEAMRAGAFHVGVKGVEAVAESLNRKYGPLQLILTGGLGRYLTLSQSHYDPDWSLRGAAVMAGLPF